MIVRPGRREPAEDWVEDQWPTAWHRQGQHRHSPDIVMELDWSLSPAPKPVRDDTDDRSRVRLMIANTFPPSFIKLRHFNLILCKLLEFPGDTH